MAFCAKSLCCEIDTFVVRVKAMYLIPIIILVILALVLVGLYNQLIGRRNQVDYAFGSIDAMLKKRFDLIPNLVETVKQYMHYEQDTLTRIVELRNSVQQNPAMPEKERMDAENKLTGLLSQLRVAVENYPDLKANQNFLQLQAAWNEIEEQLSAARRTYNAAVMSYNNSVMMFPTNIMAGMMHFQPKEVLKTDESERKNVSAKELFNS